MFSRPFCDGRMVIMLGKFLSDPKRAAVAALAAIVAAFVCMALIVGAGWMSYRNRVTPEPTVEPVSFDYCGERLTSLCVVSFGRDVFGDTIINLYVPLRKYPPFYLNVIRTSGSGRYECEINKKVRTSVYCTGAPINLGEGLNIQLFSEKDDTLLAQGAFTLNAFLVTTQTVDGEPSASDTPASKFDANETSTPSAAFGDVTLTPTNEFSDDVTFTPSPTDSSYPNYP